MLLANRDRYKIDILLLFPSPFFSIFSFLCSFPSFSPPLHVSPGVLGETEESKSVDFIVVDNRRESWDLELGIGV